ncbi:MAG: helix-turn-helix transcriptional regulator [Polyangiaceae bacterium]
MTLVVVLADRLRAVRERRGLTQVEAVARMPGSIKRGYLNDIEKGRRTNLTIEMLARIGRAYGMTVGELLDGVDYPLDDDAPAPESG